MEYTKRLLVLEGLLSTLPDCQGWMIAKCRFSLGNRKMKTSDQFPLQILKKDGRLAKIHICSFAGEEKDLATEKKIFGKDFAYIRDIANFSKIVGRYLTKQLEIDG